MFFCVECIEKSENSLWPEEEQIYFENKILSGERIRVWWGFVCAKCLLFNSKKHVREQFSSAYDS